MKKKNKKRLSVLKMTIVLIILILLSGMGVMAVTTKVNTVNIVLSDGYEMTVFTNKTKIADILKENNIIIQKDEKVLPKENESLTEDGTIKITNKSEQEIEVAKVSEGGIETNLESLLEAYDTIVEKIETKREKISYETVKKDISDGAKTTKNTVLQKGVEGIKEITYKVKYQNGTEISRIKLSEKVIKKPVNKIVQVRSNVVTSRNLDTVRPVSGSKVGIYKVTAYCACPKCCGKGATGRTASGTRATAGRTVAASSRFSFGTKLLINGKVYIVEDRGGAIQGNRIDVYMTSHSKALAWGVKYLPVQIVK